jgi:hypothetical protein
MSLPPERADINGHRWEYRLEVIGGPIHSWRRESLEVLAPLGADGWEAVGLVPWVPDHTGGPHRMGAEFLVLFKRRLPDT